MRILKKPVHLTRMVHNCSILRKSLLFRKGSWKPFQLHIANASTTSRDKSSEPNKYDVTIVGGGIIGMSTAMKLGQKYPNLKFAVLEKENRIGFHQSGHNSGVIHAGIYYKPGSLKAKLCVEGLKLSYEYLNKNNIPYKKCGKLIVAVTPEEIPRLKDLYKRGQENNVQNLKMVDKEEIRNYEPHCKGLMAIWSPETGIVDWGVVTESYASNFAKSGGKIFLNFEVSKFEENMSNIEYPITIYDKNENKVIQSKYVVTCGGLQSDRLAQMSGCSKDPKIIPFRGEYLLLSPEKCKLIHTNIYPVPDPRFPFLGVHFTPRMDGNVWLGPNAILSLKREGYSWKDFDAKDFRESISYPGFQKLAAKYVGFGVKEIIRSIFLQLQLKELQKFVPEIELKDIKRGPAGVRAQALDENGNLVDDFVFDSGSGNLSKRILHVRNCPSPGATSSLAISQIILNKIKEKFLL